jgi:hypothetical protein
MARQTAGSGARANLPTLIDDKFYKLVPQESPQVKPQDACIRQFLGGEWLEEKDGWTCQQRRVLAAMVIMDVKCGIMSSNMTAA